MWYDRVVRNTASVVILLNLSFRAFPLGQLLHLLVPQFVYPFNESNNSLCLLTFILTFYFVLGHSQLPNPRPIQAAT